MNSVILIRLLYTWIAWWYIIRIHQGNIRACVHSSTNVVFAES